MAGLQGHLRDMQSLRLAWIPWTLYQENNNKRAAEMALRFTILAVLLADPSLLILVM